MKNKAIILLTIILCISFSSCDKFLDVNPKNEVINDDMFANQEGIENALYGLYGSLRQNQLYGEYLTFSVTEVLAGNLDAPIHGGSYIYFGTYEYNNSGAKNIITSIWSKAYEVIGHCNNIIENLDKIDGSEYPLFNKYKGEAYGIRAFLHFDMLRLFAPHIESHGSEQGIPYSDSYSFKHPEFYTVSEVYDKIIADLKMAQSLLEDDMNLMSYPRVDVTTLEENFDKGRQLHFNYYAATAMLARVYWTKGDLVNASAEAYKIINSETFPLSTKDQIKGLIAGNLSEKESIWGLYSTDFYEVTSYRLATNSSSSSFGPYDPKSGGQYLQPWEDIYNQYLGDQAGNDFRMDWIGYADEENTANTLAPQCIKLLDYVRFNGGNSASTRGLLEGISLIRVPEMYYIAAEAALESGNIAEATNLINQVLNSRGLTNLENRDPVIVPDLDFLYNERHKELFCEGQRWFDMKKKNMDIISNATYSTIPASNEVYVLPIPEEEFEYRNDN